MKYRNELDGIRAMAVIAVFFYHCHLQIGGFSILPGGFLGVDIFFVLSGYLISSIVFDDIYNSKFNFISFYIKRARRILPALFVVLTFSSIITYQLLLPDDYMVFGKSALASVFFVSNYYYYSFDSYTATSSLYNFLLHTWSLSAEWQFYLLFPVFIVSVKKYAEKHLLQIVIIGFIVSLSLACFLSNRNHDLSFYSFATRAWELLAGCMVAYIEKNKESRIKNEIANQVLPLVGMTMLIYSFLFITDTSIHPGIITLIPVIGTCLIIISSSKEELVGRCLQIRPVVFIGAISYSLYLWHQIVIVTFRIVKHVHINIGQGFMLLIITLTLSIATYYYIEKPFRKSYGRGKIVLSYTSASLVIIAFLYIALSSGIPDRFGKHNLSALVLNLNGNKMHIVDGVVCHDNFIEKSCGVGKEKKGVPNVILVGDSHAGSYGYSLNRIAETKFNLVQLTSDVCLGMDTITLYDKGIIHRNCYDRSIQFSKYIDEHPTDPVIFTARLSWYLSGKQYTNEYGDVEPDLGDKQVTNNGKPLEEEILKKLNKWAKTRTLVLIYPEPELAVPVPTILTNKIQSNFTINSKIDAVNNFNFSISRSNFEERSKEAYTLLDAVKGKNVIRVYPAELLCDASKCSPYNKDKSILYYFDDDHMSVYGADMIVNSFSNRLINSF